MIDISLKLDLDKVRDSVAATRDISDNHELFEALTIVEQAKSELKEASDALSQLDGDVKKIINDRAKALYGDNWTAIKGDSFKITRSMSGSIYAIGDPEKAVEYVRVELKPDKEKIEKYIEEKKALPDGIDYNDDRKEVIRVNLNGNTKG